MHVIKAPRPPRKGLTDNINLRHPSQISGEPRLISGAAIMLTQSLEELLLRRDSIACVLGTCTQCLIVAEKYLQVI